jgi:hypothetical protein
MSQPVQSAFLAGNRIEVNKWILTVPSEDLDAVRSFFARLCATSSIISRSRLGETFREPLAHRRAVHLPFFSGSYQPLRHPLLAFCSGSNAGNQIVDVCLLQENATCSKLDRLEFQPKLNRYRSMFGELLLLAGATAAMTVLISEIWPALGPCAANGSSFGACFANSGGDDSYL